MLLLAFAACLPEKSSDSPGSGEHETEETVTYDCPADLTLHFTTTASEGDHCEILDVDGGEPIVTTCVDDELRFAVPDYASITARCAMSGDQLTCAGDNQGAHWSEDFVATGTFDADHVEATWTFDSAWTYDSGTPASCTVQGTVSGTR